MEFVNACLIESMNMRHEIHEQNIMNSMNYNDLFRVHEMHEQASCCVNSTFAELLEKQKTAAEICGIAQEIHGLAAEMTGCHFQDRDVRDQVPIESFQL